MPASTDQPAKTELRVHPPAAVIDPGSGPVVDRVKRVLELIRPTVQADGGDIEFVAFTPDNIVQIRMHGACVGCPSALVTLQTGIERNLKAHVPEVRGIQALD